MWSSTYSFFCCASEVQLVSRMDSNVLTVHISSTSIAIDHNSRNDYWLNQQTYAIKWGSKMETRQSQLNRQLWVMDSMLEHPIILHTSSPRVWANFPSRYCFRHKLSGTNISSFLTLYTNTALSLWALPLNHDASSSLLCFTLAWLHTLVMPNFTSLCASLNISSFWPISSEELYQQIATPC